MQFHVAVDPVNKSAAYAACPTADGPWRTHMQMIQRSVKEWEAENAEVRVVDGHTMRLMMARTAVTV